MPPFAVPTHPHYLHRPTEETARTILAGLLDDLDELVLQLEEIVECGGCSRHSEAVARLTPGRLNFWRALAASYLAAKERG